MNKGCRCKKNTFFQGSICIFRKELEEQERLRKEKELEQEREAERLRLLKVIVIYHIVL